MSANSRPRDAVIIGAGIVGICAALALQRAGCRVTLIDRNAPGSGCSSGNAGGITPSAVVPVATPGIVAAVPKMLIDPLSPLAIRWSYLPHLLPWLLRFLRAGAPDRVAAISASLKAILDRSVDSWAELLDETGTTALWRRQGLLYVYESDAAWRAVQRDHEMRRRKGFTVETLGTDELRQMLPALSRGHRFGAFIPACAHVVNPQRLCQALAEAFRQRGGTVVEAEVTGLDLRVPTEPRILHRDGDLAADVAVIAAGAHSRKLAAAAGAPVPLDTERGYHAMLPKPGIDIALPLMSGDGKFAVTPMEHGLRLAGTVELGGLAAAPNFERARILISQAKRMFPGLSDEDAEFWMGFRPSLPDSLAVIGPAPGAPSVILAFGHGHLGLTLGAVTGRLVAALATGQSPAIDLAAFRADRFGWRGRKPAMYTSTRAT
jgi:glycine/D-amino acid oxidase-like deaminating enzyme